MQNDHQHIARKLLVAGLDGTAGLTAREAGFLGQLAFDANQPTEKQARWLGILTDRYGQEVQHDTGA